MIRTRPNLAIATITMMIAASPIFAVGSVNQSLAQIPGSTNYVFTENWTGDAATGSVPATVMSGTTAIQGMRIVSVEVAPGSPAPTNNYTVTLTDFSGADILGGSGASQSNTTATILPSISNSPPIYGSLTVNVTGNSVASAKGSVLVYFAPVSQVFGNTPVGAGLTSNNLFTGTNTFNGTSTFTGATTFSGTTATKNLNLRLYADQFPGADACAKINNAILALPNVNPIGGIVDATGFSGNQACAANPFTGVTFGYFQLYLGAATFLTQAQWLTPAAISVQIIGMSRGDPINQAKGTSIEACTAGQGAICNSANFPSSTPILFVKGVQSQWVKNLNIDCELITGCIALQADAVAESSFFEGLKLQNFPNIGLNILANNGTNSTQNYTIRNVEMYPANASSASTVGLKITGSTQAGPYEVSNVNVIGSGGSGSCTTKILNGFQIDGIVSGTFNSLHNECVTNGINIGSVTNAANLTFVNANGGGTSTINNVVISNNTGVTNSIVLVNPTCGGGACNNVVDNTRGQTITDQQISLFENANSSGSVIKSYFPPLGIAIQGFTSGATFITTDSVGAGNWTIPGVTDRSVGRNTADTLTNKTLTSPVIGTQIVPTSAGAVDLGTTALPFGNAWLGTAATNNFKIQPASTTGARVITITDPVSPTTVGLPLTIANGTATMTTALIASQACGTVVTVAGTGIATTDSIYWNDNAQPAAATNGVLTIKAWPTSGNVNFFYCNTTTAGVTPAAATLNWRVAR